MTWLRKFFVLILAIVLLAALLGAAGASGFRLTAGKPGRVEGWLTQSGVYDHVVSSVIQHAPQTVTVTIDNRPFTISLDQTFVSQAGQKAFSPELLQANANTVINSNYAWLEGKTATPDFKVDLTAPKSDFAQIIGQYVQQQLAALPACTPTQLAQLQANPSTAQSSLTCLPPGVSPQTEAAQATQDVATSSAFLNTPVLTASSLNVNGNTQSNPYYQKLSWLPKAYRTALELPWLLGGLAVLCIVSIILLAASRRRGLRHISVVLLISGVVLVVSKFASDTAFDRLQKKALARLNNNSNQLQQPLLDFFHHVEAAFTKVEMWFGIAYLAVAVIIFAILWLTRRKGITQKPAPPQDIIQDPSPTLPTYRQPPTRPRTPPLVQ